MALYAVSRKQPWETQKEYDDRNTLVNNIAFVIPAQILGQIGYGVYNVTKAASDVTYTSLMRVVGEGGSTDSYVVYTDFVVSSSAFVLETIRRSTMPILRSLSDGHALQAAIHTVAFAIHVPFQVFIKFIDTVNLSLISNVLSDPSRPSQSDILRGMQHRLGKLAKAAGLLQLMKPVNMALDLVLKVPNQVTTIPRSVWGRSEWLHPLQHFGTISPGLQYMKSFVLDPVGDLFRGVARSPTALVILERGGPFGMAFEEAYFGLGRLKEVGLDVLDRVIRPRSPAQITYQYSPGVDYTATGPPAGGTWFAINREAEYLGYVTPQERMRPSLNPPPPLPSVRVEIDSDAVGVLPRVDVAINSDAVYEPYYILDEPIPSDAGNPRRFGEAGGSGAAFADDYGAPYEDYVVPDSQPVDPQMLSRSEYLRQVETSAMARGQKLEELLSRPAAEPRVNEVRDQFRNYVRTNYPEIESTGAKYFNRGVNALGLVGLGVEEYKLLSSKKSAKEKLAEEASLTAQVGVGASTFVAANAAVEKGFNYTGRSGVSNRMKTNRFVARNVYKPLAQKALATTSNLVRTGGWIGRLSGAVTGALEGAAAGVELGPAALVPAVVGFVAGLVASEGVLRLTDVATASHDAAYNALGPEEADNKEETNESVVARGVKSVEKHETIKKAQEASRAIRDHAIINHMVVRSNESKSDAQGPDLHGLLGMQQSMIRQSMALIPPKKQKPSDNPTDTEEAPPSKQVEQEPMLVDTPRTAQTHVEYSYPAQEAVLRGRQDRYTEVLDMPELGGDREDALAFGLTSVLSLLVLYKLYSRQGHRLAQILSV